MEFCNGFDHCSDVFRCWLENIMSVISHFHCWLDVCLSFGIRIRSVWCVKQEHLLFPWGFRNGYVSRCSPLGRTSGSLPLPYAFGTIYKIIIVEYRVGIAILRCNFPARGVVHFRIPSIPWWLYRYQIMHLFIYTHTVPTYCCRNCVATAC